MPKLLITGGAGFIGTNVALEATKRGYEVIVFDSLVRNKTEENLPVLEKAGVRLIRGDIRSKDDLKRIPPVDAVIHLAGNPGIPWSIAWPVYDFEVNTYGTLNMLEWVKRQQEMTDKEIPFVFASTNKVYSDLMNETPLNENKSRYEWRQPRGGWIDGISPSGISEGFPIDGFGLFPHSPYGVSKTAADLYCQEYFHAFGVPTVIFRMSCIYGYYQKGVEDQGWIDHFVRSIAYGDGKLNIYGDGKQVRDMLWGEDVANLYLDAVEKIDKAKGGVFNVGGGIDNTLSLREAIAYVEELSGKKASITTRPWRHADQKIYISDIAKIKLVLDWSPKTTPKEGIKKMYERYKKQL